MARIRQIKPEFFLDEGLAVVSAHARLMFIGLWLISDRCGRLEDRPRMIRARCFPYESDLDVDALLDELELGNFIVRYAIKDVQVIQIRTFAKHQRPHPKEPESTLPAPPAAIVTGRAVKRNGRPRKETAGCADSGSLGSGSLDPPIAPQKPGAPGAPVTGSAGDAPTAGQSPGGKPQDPGGTAFDRFWRNYPRKVGKEAARRAWARAAKRVGSQAKLLELVKATLPAAKASEQWTRDAGQFVPHPATWLNQGRFEDPVEVEP